MSQSPGGWRDDVEDACFDPIRERAKPEATIIQIGRKVNQPFHRSVETIELPDDQYVASARVRQRFS
jgi:hypothetical protein